MNNYHSHKNILSSIIQPVLNRMSIQYSVGSDFLYEMIHYYEEIQSIKNGEYTKLSIAEDYYQLLYYDNDQRHEMTRRLKIIFPHIISPNINTQDLSFLQMIAAPKIYDQELQYSMLETYAEAVHINVPTLITSKRLEGLDIQWNDNDWEEYYTSQEKIRFVRALSEYQRTEFTLSEVTLLTCIYVSTHGQSITTLNTPRDSYEKKKVAKKWLSSMADVLFSKEIHCILLSEFLFQIRCALKEMDLFALNPLDEGNTHFIPHEESVFQTIEDFTEFLKALSIYYDYIDKIFPSIGAVELAADPRLKPIYSKKFKSLTNVTPITDINTVDSTQLDLADSLGLPYNELMRSPLSFDLIEILNPYIEAVKKQVAAMMSSFEEACVTKEMDMYCYLTKPK